MVYEELKAELAEGITVYLYHDSNYPDIIKISLRGDNDDRLTAEIIDRTRYKEFIEDIMTFSEKGREDIDYDLLECKFFLFKDDLVKIVHQGRHHKELFLSMKVGDIEKLIMIALGEDAINIMPDYGVRAA